MRKTFVWYQINGAVQFATRVLAAEEPTLYVIQAGAGTLRFALDDPQVLGKLLWDESVRSMASLYGAETAATHEQLFGPYEYVEPAHAADDALLFMLQCSTIEGLSCGSSDYHTTTAWRVLHALMLRGMRHVRGWDAVPWPTRPGDRGPTSI